MLLAQPVHLFGAKTQEDVAFAILTRARLEEASRLAAASGELEPAQALLNLGGCHAESNPCA